MALQFAVRCDHFLLSAVIVSDVDRDAARRSHGRHNSFQRVGRRAVARRNPTITNTLTLTLPHPRNRRAAPTGIRPCARWTRGRIPIVRRSPYVRLRSAGRTGTRTDPGLVMWVRRTHTIQHTHPTEGGGQRHPGPFAPSAPGRQHDTPRK